MTQGNRARAQHHGPSAEAEPVKAYRRKLQSMGEETLARARAVGARIARAHAKISAPPPSVPPPAPELEDSEDSLSPL
jgi:hypothetical protein